MPWRSNTMQSLADLTRPRGMPRSFSDPYNPNQQVDLYGEPPPEEPPLPPPYFDRSGGMPGGPGPGAMLTKQRGVTSLADLVNSRTGGMQTAGRNDDGSGGPRDPGTGNPPPGPGTGPTRPPGTVIPGSVSLAGKPSDRFAPSNFNEQAIVDGYRRMMGRPPTGAEVQRWLGNLGDVKNDGALNRALQSIYDLPEAAAYRESRTRMGGLDTPIDARTPIVAPPPPPPGSGTGGTPPPGTGTPYSGTGPAPPRNGQPGDFSRTRGFAEANWGTMDSVKYRAGEILARYPHTPEGLQQAFNDPDWRNLFPNARILDLNSGVIDFGGVLSDFSRGVPVRRVDVGQAFQPGGGVAWVWQDLDNDPGLGAGGGNGGGGNGGSNGANRPPAIPPHTPITPPGQPTTGTLLTDARPEVRSQEPYRLLAPGQVPLSELIRGRR